MSSYDFASIRNHFQRLHDWAEAHGMTKEAKSLNIPLIIKNENMFLLSSALALKHPIEACFEIARKNDAPLEDIRFIQQWAEKLKLGQELHDKVMRLGIYLQNKDFSAPELPAAAPPRAVAPKNFRSFSRRRKGNTSGGIIGDILFERELKRDDETPTPPSPRR